MMHGRFLSDGGCQAVLGGVYLMAAAMAGAALLAMVAGCRSGDRTGAGQPLASWGPPEDVEFKAEVDGTVQRYVLMLPAGFDVAREHHLLVALHGHGSDRWQYVKEARGECLGARDVALRHDMVFVSPDYRAPDSWMGPKAEADVVQIIRDLRRQCRIGKVFLVGGSMGGASVLAFTALHPDLVDGVSSQNGMANMLEFEGFQDSFRKSYGGDKTQKPEEYRKRSAEFHVRSFTMPVALTTGGQDAAVPPQSVLRFAEALKKARGRVLLIHREKGGHSTNYDDTVAALEFVVREALAGRE